ncbi:MAG: FAD-binding oxidoreductase [Gammaproteobacteria bacterium]|nr:FAD-binding oxidoreductase [Gammaproteobacteria bacterium]
MTIRFATDYPDSYYAASANPHPRHAALEGEVEADVCVVGAGFTGVSAALHLAERGYRVALLEAARIGWGASGRNGGQLGTGLRKDLIELEPRLGRARARELWDMAAEAMDIVRARIERHAIACDYKRGNLLAATRRRYLPELAAEVELVSRHYGYDGYRMLDETEVREAVASEQYCGGRMDSGGGHLHPLNFVLGMAQAALDTGVRIFEGSRVERIDWRAQPRVETAAGSVRSRYVLLCGNAYLGTLEPRIAPTVMPIANHVLATEPLGETTARALIRDDCCVCATKYVVDYYRFSADHRMLFGGGESYSYDDPPDLKGFVRRYMLKVFPQLRDARIDYAWSGQLAITMDRMPHFGRLGSTGFFVQGFSGSGVVLSQLAGKLMAEAVAGSAERFDVFASIDHRRFPGGRWLRKPMLVAGMLYYALKDRLP